MVVPNSRLTSRMNPAHLALLLLIHTGHRLVEQEQLGRAHQGAREIDTLLNAIGQASRRRRRDASADLEEVEGNRRRLRRSTRSSARARRRRSACSNRLVRLRAVRPAITLSRTRRCLNSALCWNVRPMPLRAAASGRAPVEPPPVEQNFAGIGAVDPVDDIEQRALASTVRSDQRADLATATSKLRLVSAWMPLNDRETSRRRSIGSGIDGEASHRGGDEAAGLPGLLALHPLDVAIARRGVVSGK